MKLQGVLPKSRRHRVVQSLLSAVVGLVTVCSGTAGASAPTTGARLPDEPGPTAPTGSSFSSIPAKEIKVNGSLTPVSSQDFGAVAFGKTDGQVAIVMVEDVRLKSRHSADGGGTFGAEVRIGGSAAPDVKAWDAVASSDGKIYAAYVAVDPAGDVGLQFSRSDDMGQSWTAPKILVQSGDASMGVWRPRVATGAAGQAAIVYRGSGQNDPWVVATTDSGATWTTPQRIDTGVAARSTPSGGEAIAMDSAGRIYAFYAQNRGSGSTVFYTRSTNGGVTFAAEQALTLPAHANSGRPHVAVAFDGGVLVTLHDMAGPDHIYVLRSTDQGQTYSTVLNRTLAADNVRLVPRLATSSASAVTFVSWVRSSGELVVDRSTDSGATWGSDQVLVATAAGALNQTTSFGFSRTSAGTWVVGWTDDRSDPNGQLLTDVYARSSTDSGVTWSAEQRVDGGTPGSHTSTLEDIAANASNNVFVVYEDGRDDVERSFDFYANTSAANPLTFGADYRVDLDDGTVPPEVIDQVVVASDGASHAYEAFPAFTTGPASDVLVAASGDAGHTFGAPVRVGGTTAGTRISLLPEIRALSDGRVYLVYLSDNPGVGREVRLNRSTNFGVTWQASDTILATLNHPPGYFENYDWPGTSLEALSDGTVYIAWSDGANVFLARSTNSGVSFSTADVDQDSRGSNRYPRICANGSLLVLSWLSPNIANTETSVWASTSADKGVTWAVSKQLRTEGAAGSVDLHAAACDAAGHAVVVWPDPRNGLNWRLFTSRFDGSLWSTDAAASGPSGVDEFFPDVMYVGASTAIVVYGDLYSTIYASRSTDDGATFPTFQQLDATTPDPGARSYLGQIAADGTGNVWVSWFDSSAGLDSLVVRRSADSGATFGTVYRLDSKTPQGGYFSLNFETFLFNPPYGSMSATLPGVAFFGWAAERESRTFDALFNAYDINDFDRDGVLAGVDCNDSDSTLKSIPPDVAGLALSKVSGATRFAWTSEDPTAGTATNYDFARGLLSALRSSGTFGGAACLANDVSDTPYDDASPNPPVGDGYWYLMRGQNACGTGTYGRSSLDAASPCS